MNRLKNRRWNPENPAPLRRQHHVHDDSRSVLAESVKNMFFASTAIRRFFSAETLRSKFDLSDTELNIFFGVCYGTLFGVGFGLIYGTKERREMSFEEFRSMLLEPGLVTNIVVDGRFAIVEAKSSSIDGKKFVHYRPTKNSPYILEIESHESFKEKLEKAQETLGIHPLHYIPVTDVSSIVFQKITFEELKIMLVLRRVEGIVVDDTYAIVELKSSRLSCLIKFLLSALFTPRRPLLYTLSIESPESFKAELEKAQKNQELPRVIIYALKTLHQRARILIQG